MKKRTWLVGVAVVLALAGGAVVTRDVWNPQGAVAQAPRPNPQARGVPVVTAVAEKKKVPLQVELLGTVTPIASVAIKSRLETEIVGVHFNDGAMVKQGDLLFTLDGRAIEAQIRDLDAVLVSAKAQLEQNERDLERYIELVAKNATTQVQLNNTRTQVNVSRATGQLDLGQDREPQGAAVLLHDPRADLRTRQHGRGEGRQFRAAGRPRAARHHHPDRAGLCRVRAAAEQPAGVAPGARRRKPPPSRRSSRARRGAPTATSR